MAPPGWLFGRNTPYTPTLYPPTSATRIGESLIRSFGSLSMKASMLADVTSTAGGAAVWATAAPARNDSAASTNRVRAIMTFLDGDLTVCAIARSAGGCGLLRSHIHRAG